MIVVLLYAFLGARAGSRLNQLDHGGRLQIEDGKHL